MQELTLTFQYQLLSEIELDAGSKELLSTARQACDTAYAPYSLFRVGAALICADGSVYSGANVENASYPLSLCAEAALISAYRNSGTLSPVKMIAISIRSKTGQVNYPVMPCGGCRQILVELEQQQSPIVMLMQGDTGDIMQLQGISNLIPLAFSGKELD